MTTSTSPAPTTPAPQASPIAAVVQRLESSALSEEVASLVREALEGVDDSEAAVIRGVYLKSITVEGFRGIGEAATLHIPSGPGLTVVQGRNGSGKSSFAEGIEVALTGRNRRWEDEDGKNVQTAQQDGWRNLHHTGGHRLELELLASGRVRPLTLTRTWAGGASFAESEPAVLGLGPTPLPLSALGWAEELRSFRPILSYSELGQMMTAKPSRMYDRLATLLGLGALSEAGERLAAREQQLALSEKQAKAALPPLVSALTDVADERVQDAVTALQQRVPDRERIRSLIAGAPLADTTELARLRRTAALSGPDTDAVTEAVARLREAVATAEDVRHGDAGDALARADLLDRALQLRSQHPTDHTCPVCLSTDRLDDAWVAAAAAQADLLREEAAEARSAQQAVRDSADGLRALIRNRAADLPDHLHALWDEWVACRGIRAPHELAVAVEKQAAALADACRHVRQEAERRLAEQDEQWRGVVPQLASWLALADAVAETKPLLARVKKARAWLKEVQAELREARMRSIAETAQSIWQYLSQESNVALGDVTLKGSEAYTGRGVALNVTVDDVDASALGVVSQGELFSLALALFLPRAMAAQSPFDFIVIDDPVQSMDPRKVEGLARLLEEIARTHQVVVFSHDTRLPDALRFHRIKATILEVGRFRRSKVTVRSVDDPVKRELAAARAVARDNKVTAAILSEVLPGQCRLALEAALQESARRTLLGTGMGHLAIEERIGRARELTDLAALALFGEIRGKADVYREIGRRLGPDASNIVGLCNRGAHTTIPDTADAMAFISRVAAATEGLRSL
ncbi:AAA family ATPase [Kitasatospora sp. DSM 101779]|uniref:AAA family ATPase n=1 Tax=Kitasatospora sp. DSM 101779 TaxID=2853165 RepID=UPI0021DA04F5|nr:AAA family ATPase [Kitasatospora sp. DSM 101779]MCU7823232.1 AAA family ATPase [Kitasatospora sp. DSM 101779]